MESNSFVANPARLKKDCHYWGGLGPELYKVESGRGNVPIKPLEHLGLKG